MKLTHGMVGLFCIALLNQQVIAQQDGGRFGPVQQENVPAKEMVKPVDSAVTQPLEGHVTTGYDKAVVAEDENSQKAAMKNAPNSPKVRPGFGVSRPTENAKNKVGVKQRMKIQKAPQESSGKNQKHTEPEKSVN